MNEIQSALGKEIKITAEMNKENKHVDYKIEESPIKINDKTREIERISKK